MTLRHTGSWHVTSKKLDTNLLLSVIVLLPVSTKSGCLAISRTDHDLHVDCRNDRL